MDYGGMEFPEISTLQDQVQIDYLLRQLRWDKVVANDFLVTLDSVQLCSSFTRPILEVSQTKLHHRLVPLSRQDGSEHLDRGSVVTPPPT
jgi:hypothetical protein